MRESLGFMENIKNSKQSCWQLMAIEAEKKDEQKPGRGSWGSRMRIIDP